MIPNAEKLVANRLREEADLRVVAKTPKDTDSAWVRLTLLDAPQGNSPADHLVAFYLQLDCYAGKKGGEPEAIGLALAAREVLTGLGGTYDEGVVTGGRINGMARIPDVDLEPARERVVMTATVWAHA